MTRPADYQLIVPDGWQRIDLQPGIREPALARMVERQFRGADGAAGLKSQAREQLLQIASHAYRNGGLELYVSLQTAAGFPLPASLVVTLAPPHDNAAVTVTPERLAQALTAVGNQVTLTDIAAGRAVRVRRQAEVTTLDIHVPVPDSGAYLMLSFSTPLKALADAHGRALRQHRQYLEVGSMSKDPGWKLSMKYPPGWIQLPTGGRDKPDRWVGQKARETLGAQASPERVKARAEDLAKMTYGARARNDWYGLVFYPPSASGLVALLDIKAYQPGREYRTMTLDVLEEVFGGPSADTVGDAVVNRQQLPGGAAVRVRRIRAEAGDPAGQSTLIEGVTHAIKPPGIDGAVEVTMTWTALQLGDKLAEMADAIARTIRITPA